MSDTSIKIKDSDGVAHEIDTRSIPGGDERQVFLLGDGENSGLLSPATEPTLLAILAALGQQFEAGQAVALDAASLAALENITATLSGPVEVDNASGGPLGVKQTGIAPPLGYEQLSISTAVGLGTIPTGAVTALVIPHGGAVRWRDDGTNPTTAAGMYLAADTPLTYQGSLSALKLIAVTGTVEVNVSFYGLEA